MLLFVIVPYCSHVKCEIRVLSYYMQAPTTLRKVQLAGLKRFALERLPDGPLRDDILAQPDELAADDLLANARVWLRLARFGVD